MVFRIVIAGESQCIIFAEICLVADYLSQNLPNFCYEIIEQPVLEWESWLCKLNMKNKWHHEGSPIVWKELLMKGSKPYYIGGAPEFLDYCHSYYEFDSFLATEKFEGLVNNFTQYKKKEKRDQEDVLLKVRNAADEAEDSPPKTNYTICISGVKNPLATYLISGLLEMSSEEKCISRIYIYDKICLDGCLSSVEQECSYIGTSHAGKVVKLCEKLGAGLSNTDLFILLDHVPLKKNVPIGTWLNENKVLMNDFSVLIKASASRKMLILLPNLGPACYNATVLTELLHSMKNNIVVATSDLGLEVVPTIAEIAEIPMRNIFCPPVWGFVGVNHLIDIRTTVHKYNAFEPYNRYTKVRNSSLNIGSITPEMRTLDYLMHFDETLWKKMAEKKKTYQKGMLLINKAIATLNVVKLWLLNPRSDYIINLGIPCNGSFGLTFKGHLSQPARLIDGEWLPASDYLLPRDSQMKLKYLEQMAETAMGFKNEELPQIFPYCPCFCKSNKIF